MLDKKQKREMGCNNEHMSSDFIDFKSLLASMNSRAEFLLPFVSAQSQFRERYYGLAAAAMLEDLFFDSMSSFIRTHRPGVQLRRPPRGEKGYDYEFEGLRISHKVSQGGPIAVAALWDATRTAETHWSFDTPICFVSSNFSKKKIKFYGGENEVLLFPLNSGTEVTLSQKIVLGYWIDNHSKFKIASTFSPKSIGLLRDTDSFEARWSDVNALELKGIHVNQIEMFLVPSGTSILSVEVLVADDGVDFYRPGFYLFEKSDLQNIEVEHNNRAILMPKSKVASLMKAAAVGENFVPISSWFSSFSSPNPPDLYLAQRRSFDEMFSIYRSR